VDDPRLDRADLGVRDEEQDGHEVAEHVQRQHLDAEALERESARFTIVDARARARSRL